MTYHAHDIDPERDRPAGSAAARRPYGVCLDVLAERARKLIGLPWRECKWRGPMDIVPAGWPDLAPDAFVKLRFDVSDKTLESVDEKAPDAEHESLRIADGGEVVSFPLF